MTEIIANWRAEIEAELTEARGALADATTTAQLAQERHRAALTTVEAVKLALGRLPGLGGSLAHPIAGRVTAVGLDVETAATAARRSLLDEREAAARVARLELAVAQLGAILAAADEPLSVAA